MGKGKTNRSFEQSLIIGVKGSFVPRCRWNVSMFKLAVTEVQRLFLITLREEASLALLQEYFRSRLLT